MFNPSMPCCNIDKYYNLHITKKVLRSHLIQPKKFSICFGGQHSYRKMPRLIAMSPFPTESTSQNPFNNQHHTPDPSISHASKCHKTVALLRKKVSSHTAVKHKDATSNEVTTRSYAPSLSADSPQGIRAILHTRTVRRKR